MYQSIIATVRRALIGPPIHVCDVCKYVLPSHRAAFHAKSVRRLLVALPPSTNTKREV